MGEGEENAPAGQAGIASASIDAVGGVKKRQTAYKFFIKDILAGKPVMNGDRLSYLEIGSKNVVRVNVLANVIDTFSSEGEKKYSSITLDDATGQIRANAFGDDVTKLNSLSLGNTLVLIGVLRFFNNEVYISPEVVKLADTKYLLVRKLELEIARKGAVNTNVAGVRDKIYEMVKDAESHGGVETEQVILKLPYPPDSINSEIKKLLEDGLLYEPRPGMLRYLGQ